MNSDLFITGTDTNVGKTLLSAVLVAALNRKYWKPIQTGACEGTDREMVMRWAGLGANETYPETYIFQPAVSPHLAAEQCGTRIDLVRIQRPESPAALIIEGAGGVFVPINENAFMLDLMRQLRAPVLVATRTTLGTINHTLLTIAAIRDAGIDLHGVVIIGKPNADNQHAIERYGKVPVVGSVPWLDTINRDTLISVFHHHFDPQAFV